MCSCLKGFVMPKELTDLTVETWGPIFWKLLHMLSTRVGNAGEIGDADAATWFSFVINGLPTVLPCASCQEHTRTYLKEHKFDPRGFNDAALRIYIEKWLLDFHNAVRERKSQPIIVETVEAYELIWRTAEFKPCDNESLELFFKYGKMYHVIEVANISRWLAHLKRLRLLLGV